MTGEQKDWRKNGKKATEGREKAKRFNDAKFVQYELDKESQAMCKAWDLTSDALVDMLNGLADSGYRITVKYDTYSSSYAASMQEVHDTGRNSGLILTGRGTTAVKALKQLFFKHFHIMDGVWGEYAGFDFRSNIDD